MEEVSVQSGDRIRFFSRLLRWACYLGMASLFIVPIIYWIYDGMWLHEFKDPRWYIDFSGLPFDQIEYIPPLIKLIALFIELIRNTFFWMVLFALSRLLRSFEGLKFFTKETVLSLKMMGSFLLLSQLFQPFYLLLRGYLWSLPDQKIIIAFHDLVGIKTLFLCGMIFLLASVFNQMKEIEEEHQFTI
ncbi:hypothetical protein [Rhabdochlamydiaceae symbiont of Dictyostelium giganteum]|uniref:hypothetical protein n=1 Tax=Rhabdochlamydiaceae symbiont of Dictyostelium giganteum TaxID=3342349 RepID=UPI0038503BF6